MKANLVLLVCCLAVAQGRSLLADADHPEPATPKYSVINTTGGTEVREYENGTWAVSLGRSRWSLELAAVYAAKGLFKYYLGENSEHLKIRPSIPAITTVLRGPPPHGPHGPHGPPGHHNDSLPHGPPDHKHKHHHPHPPPPPDAVLVATYVDVKGEAPRPDDPHIKLKHVKNTTVYTHAFGGWAISWLVKREIGHLAGDLKELGLKPCRGKFFVATYDPPLKVFDRHNEVWWVELPKHKHHNKTEGSDFEAEFEFERPELSGFQLFDPLEMFPEEFPPPPEDLPKPEDDSETWLTVEGEDPLVTSEYTRDAQLELSDFISDQIARSPVQETS